MKTSKGLRSVTFELLDDKDQSPFPEYQRAMPTVAGAKSTGARVHGFDGLYLARIGHVQKALKARGCTIQVGVKAGEPLRAEVKGDLGDAVVVVMPCRI